MNKSMSQALSKNGAASRVNVNDRALKHLANSIFKQLQDEGCEPRDIISVSSQLIGLVTHELAKDETPGSV